MKPTSLILMKPEVTYGTDTPELTALVLRPSGSVPAAVKRADVLPIDHNVPLPADASLGRGIVKNTLRAMRCGDSTVIKSVSAETFYSNAKTLGIRIRICKLGAEKRTARVWRLS